MSAISNWLLELAVSDFSFSREDLESDCKELLCMKGRDPVDSWEAVENLWKHMQQWQLDKEYLASLDLHIIIAKHIRASASKDDKFDILEKWKDSNLKIDADALANELHQLIRKTLEERTPHNCVQNDTKMHDPFQLMPVKEFHGGLEHFIGYPSLNVDHVKAMKIEHERDETFEDSRGREINPKVEWNIVVQTGEWKLYGISCEPAYSIKERKIGLDYEHYVISVPVQYAAAALNKAEVIALRLWTGPMHCKYVQDLRGQDASGTQPAYPNTLHAINSGITKLAQVWRLPSCRKVYRGYKSKVQLKAAIRKDDSGCRGGVERSFLATTEEFDVAVNYSEKGAFILEISVGQVDKGAEIGWLSQFPHEKEILFNALSNVEVLGNQQMHFVKGKGGIQVYKVEISSNTKSKTLEEYVCLRRDLHLNMTDVLVNQALRAVEQRKQDANNDLVRQLCDECEAHSNVIVRRGNDAVDAFFNEGRDGYIELVGDVIRFQRQCVLIVDMALLWFEKREACPLELMSLATWQLQALKSVFGRCAPPEITALIMEGRSKKLCKMVFHTTRVNLKGEVLTPSAALSAARLVSLNPKLRSLDFVMHEELAKADFWEKLFSEFSESSAKNLCINDFALCRYASWSLKRLDFRNQESEGKMLVAALVHYPPITLTDLRVQNCPIACDGAETLGHALSRLQNLVSLSLSECEVENEGCTGIAKALTELTALRFLDLSRNKIENSGALELAQVLSRLHALKILDLNHNKMENQGASALAGVANPNLSLTNLTQLELVDVRFNKAQLRPLQLGHSCRLKTNILSEFRCRYKIECLAWSPEGSQIASASVDKTIIIWDAKTGEQKKQLKGHSSMVQSVSWSPDGSKLASGSTNNTIIIWDVETGEQTAQLKGHKASYAVQSVAWNPRGSKIASGSADKTIIIWDAVSSEQKTQLKGHTNWVQSVAWSPEESKIVSGGGDWQSATNEIIIWNAEDGSKIAELKGHTQEVTSVAWSPGSKIASGSWDKTIIIWDAETGEQKSQLKGHSEAVLSVAWSPEMRAPK